ncbi:enoyl-CoA hydratase/isomerase family protein [Pigmentiphaga soli]|uniref:Enoyl-CoA hydratase/isomerase family protein n=1 Tax=Pigmentiphaga soli TaxID=1007095 RepID=A0ABP8H916_9BURK
MSEPRQPGEDLAWNNIRLLDRGAYAIIVIDREDKRNAVDRACRRGLMSALDHARGRYPAVVLTGVGQSFCAGIDLKERAADLEKGDFSASGEWVDVNVAIRAHSAVFIAAVNGTALGGGATLINVCDLAIAADDIQMGMPEMSFATYPAMAGPSTQLSLSRKRAAWMVLTAERIGARQALEWGLINRCVARADLMAEAAALAERVAGFDPVALAGAKQALDQIPAVITDWRQGFAFGELVNAKIQNRRADKGNPFANAVADARRSAQPGGPDAKR